MNEQRGSYLLETLLAIGLVAAMAPFVYMRIANVTTEINDIRIARQIMEWRAPISGYIRENQASWGEYIVGELDRRELTRMAPREQSIVPLVAFVEKFTHAGGATVESFIVFSKGLPPMQSMRIARELGANAAVADDAAIAFSNIGGWSIQSDILMPGDIIYRLSMDFITDDSYAFLHRINADDESLNTMERNLLMGRNDIQDARTITGGNLESVRTGAWFVNAEEFNVTDAVFNMGANMDASAATINSMRVAGDLIGFRNIRTTRFQGTGALGNWSAQGNIVADRVVVTDAINVGRDMNVQSHVARSVSGITKLTAYSMNVPFIHAEQIIFADGFGLSVSNELAIGGDLGPLRIGSWDFPRVISPRFGQLEITSAPEIDTSPPTGFEDIMRGNWRDLTNND